MHLPIAGASICSGVESGQGDLGPRRTEAPWQDRVGPGKASRISRAWVERGARASRRRKNDTKRRRKEDPSVLCVPAPVCPEEKESSGYDKRARIKKGAFAIRWAGAGSGADSRRGRPHKEFRLGEGALKDRIKRRMDGELYLGRGGVELVAGPGEKLLCRRLGGGRRRKDKEIFSCPYPQVVQEGLWAASRRAFAARRGSPPASESLEGGARHCFVRVKKRAAAERPPFASGADWDDWLTDWRTDRPSVCLPAGIFGAPIDRPGSDLKFYPPPPPPGIRSAPARPGPPLLARDVSLRTVRDIWRSRLSVTHTLPLSLPPPSAAVSQRRPQAPPPARPPAR